MCIWGIRNNDLISTSFYVFLLFFELSKYPCFENKFYDHPTMALRSLE